MNIFAAIIVLILQLDWMSAFKQPVFIRKEVVMRSINNRMSKLNARVVKDEEQPGKLGPVDEKEGGDGTVSIPQGGFIGKSIAWNSTI